MPKSEASVGAWKIANSESKSAAADLQSDLDKLQDKYNGLVKLTTREMEAQLRKKLAAVNERISQTQKLPVGGALRLRQVPCSEYKDGYIVYDPLDEDDVRYSTTKAFNSWIAPEIQASHTGKDPDELHLRTAIERLRILRERFVPVRTHQSFFKFPYGTLRKPIADMKPLHVLRRGVQFNDLEKELFAVIVPKALEKLDRGVVAPGLGANLTMTQAFPDLYLDEANDARGEEPAKARYNKRIHVPSVLGPLSDHLMFYDLRHRTTEAWKEARNDSLALLLLQMRKADALGICEMFKDDPEPFNDLIEIVKQFVFGAPKLRQFLRDILEHFKSAPEDSTKIIILTQYPKAAEVVHKLLGHVGITSVLLSSTQTADERFDETEKKFNGQGNESPILIATYTLKLVGLNLHPYCYKVICLD